jgi:hypothetical protein
MPKPQDFEGLARDEWLVRKSPLHPAKLHALGVVTFAWNTCELHLFFLFCVVTNLDTAMGRIIAHDMGDVAIVDRIREIIGTTFINATGHVFTSEESEIIENVLKVYDLCRQNRNTLTHFQVETLGGELLLARIRGPKWTSHVIPNDLKDFRRVADEIWDLSLWIRQVWRAMASRRNGVMLPLPEKQPLPDLLWKPPQTTPTKRKRPPQPSRASRRRDALKNREKS